MRLGIIGGMGPLATAYFMELIAKMTKADSDGEHLETIVYNCPGIPDRTKYILGESKDNPYPKMLQKGQALVLQGADCVAIPCMTAHYFRDRLVEQGIPVIHGIRETARTLYEAGAKRVGIMATDGTIRSGIFQKELESFGLEVVIPDEEYQREVMSMIYDGVKAGHIPEEARVYTVKDYFIHERKAQAVILGCTELSLLKQAYDLGDGVIDTLEVLAKTSILKCGKEINPEFESLCVPCM